MEKCVQLGVPPGPLLGELKAGRDVVLDNGNVVKAADVVDASTETPQVGFSFLITVKIFNGQPSFNVPRSIDDFA